MVLFVVFAVPCHAMPCHSMALLTTQIHIHVGKNAPIRWQWFGVCAAFIDFSRGIQWTLNNIEQHWKNVNWVLKTLLFLPYARTLCSPLFLALLFPLPFLGHFAIGKKKKNKLFNIIRQMKFHSTNGQIDYFFIANEHHHDVPINRLIKDSD